MPTRESYPLLSVEQARERILGQVSPLPAERVGILEALGRVLVEDVLAEADVPPHTNSAMDGYALRADDLTGQPEGELPRLRVVGELAAGQVWDGEVAPGQALRIMTGAPLPLGADTVVRFEDTRVEDGWVIVERSPQRGSNVRCAGEDVRAGTVVLRAGQALRPQEIGMLASTGHATACVHRRPRVAVLATGDEVLPIDAPPAPGKIRDINSYSNAAQVLALGGEPLVLEIAADREQSLTERLRRALELGADLIVTSGGVSAGDFDLVKEVLAAQGKMDFWWVNMKPGRPMAFGALDGVPVLALPGNPVAAMVSFYLFGRPALLKMMGHRSWDPPSVLAHLRDQVERRDATRRYLRVRLIKTGGEFEAELTGEQGSGILASMVAADGLAVIPEERGTLRAGSLVRVLLFEPRCAGGRTLA